MTKEYTASKTASPTTLSDEDFSVSATAAGGDVGWPFDIDEYVNTVDLEGRVIQVNEGDEPSE